MTDKQKNILKYTLVGTTGLNLIMCLNLYRQIVEIDYTVHSMDSNIMSTFQSLSKDVGEIKNSMANDSENYSGEFE